MFRIHPTSTSPQGYIPPPLAHSLEPLFLASVYIENHSYGALGGGLADELIREQSKTIKSIRMSDDGAWVWASDEGRNTRSRQQRLDLRICTI